MSGAGDCLGEVSKALMTASIYSGAAIVWPLNGMRCRALHLTGLQKHFLV